MKLTASLAAAAVLSFSALAAHATPVEPFGNGTVLLVNGTALDSATSLTAVSNGVQFSTNNSLVTVTYLATPLAGVFNFTDVCTSVSLGLGGVTLGTPCKALAVSFTDANFGVANVGVAVGAALTESVVGNVGTINVAQNASIGASSGSLTYGSPNPGTSPVPEPGTLSLMATGLLGAAGALRRRFQV